MEEYSIEFKINELFKKELKKRGIKISWIAEQTGFCIDHTSRMLLGKSSITETTREKINELLGTNY